MILHVHYCYLENSGEIRRIKNINQDIAQGLDKDIVEVAFISWKHFFHLSKYRFKLSSSVRKKLYFPVLPLSYSNVISKCINSYYNSLILLILYWVYKPTYVLGELSFQAQRLMPKSATNIIDIHGALPEEYEYSSSFPSKAMISFLNNLEKEAMLNSKFVICQSDAMKKHLRNKYNFLDDKNIYVYRCAMNPSLFFQDNHLRNVTRESLGIKKDECLFVYSGGFHKWQKVPESLCLFRNYQKAHCKSHFLILTLDIDKVQNFIDENFYDIRNLITIKSVTNKEVCAYLNASDIAFLLRDNTVMNAVAYPTKLSEYLACGLPVITTEVSKYWVSRSDFLFNIESKKMDELSSFIESQDKVNIAKYALSHLSLNVDQEQVALLLRNEGTR